MGFLNTPTSEDEHLVYITPKSKFRQTLVSVIVGIIVILVIIGAAWLGGKKQAQQAAEDTINSLNARVEELENQIIELKKEPAVVNPVSPTIDLQLLHSKIEAISELATVKYLYTDASEFSDSKQFINWNVPGTKKSFILKWDGTIKAGVDLKRVELKVLENTSTDENAKKNLVVYVPAAEILSYEVDDDSVNVLNESSNIFNPITVNDKVSFDSATKKAMESRAIENGLLDKAQENAEEVLKQLICFDPEIEENYTLKFYIIH